MADNPYRHGHGQRITPYRQASVRARTVSAHTTFPTPIPTGMMRNTLTKPERLNRKKIIEKLFAGGARSFSLFPLRVVYMPADGLQVPASMMVSVSKRRFKQSVRRNRVKRQIREAYRKNKHILVTALEGGPVRVAVAFLYLSDNLLPSSLIEERMQTALHRISENLLRQP